MNYKFPFCPSTSEQSMHNLSQSSDCDWIFNMEDMQTYIIVQPIKKNTINKKVIHCVCVWLRTFHCGISVKSSVYINPHPQGSRICFCLISSMFCLMRLGCAQCKKTVILSNYYNHYFVFIITVLHFVESCIMSGSFTRECCLQTPVHDQPLFFCTGPI